MGLKPEFSASAMGMQSSASEKARIAYCSRPGLCSWSACVSDGYDDLLLEGMCTFTAASSTASEQATSAAPPP